MGCLVGCNNEPIEYDRNDIGSKRSTVYGFGLRIVEIDSCQYVLYVDDTRGAVGMAHHNNCKYCRERNSQYKSIILGKETVTEACSGAPAISWGKDVKLGGKLQTAWTDASKSKRDTIVITSHKINIQNMPYIYEDTIKKNND